MTAAALRRAEAGRATRFVLVGITGLAVNTAALAAFSSGLHLHYLVGVVLPRVRCEELDVAALLERVNAELASHQRVARIVVWPESAAPDDAIGEPWTREAFGRIAMRSGAWQVVAGGLACPVAS